MGAECPACGIRSQSIFLVNHHTLNTQARARESGKMAKSQKHMI